MARDTTRADRGKSGVRAAWADVVGEIARATGHEDTPAEKGRDGIDAGQWDGYPTARLPPNCPVIPLGLNGKAAYFVDTSGQLIAVTASEWGKKMLLHLFAGYHNYLHWAWPKWSSPNAKGKTGFTINGIEVDEAMSCLLNAAQRKGIFSADERVRGRGAWKTAGGMVWHAGDRIFRMEGGRLQTSAPGEIDGIFYPNLFPCTSPWAEPVKPADSPANDILEALKSWNWERPGLDPILVLGWIGVAWLGGALEWRPHLFTTGDKGVGKSTLHALIKAIFGHTLLSSADTTPAGIYQAVKQDCLPVAIDELEADADNRRAKGVVTLARLASSGAVMHRGGAEHSGVSFTMRNGFFFSAINPPPLEAADKSRLAMLNLGRLDPRAVRKPLTINDATGRMILRSLMDGYAALGDATTPGTLVWKWREELREGGVDSRGQDTWGTLLAVAELMVGEAGLESAGLPVCEGEPGYVGRMVAAHTANERSEAQENWVDCLDYLLGSSIDAWKDGERPTIGGALEHWEAEDGWNERETNRRLSLVGLRVLSKIPGTEGTGKFLAIPTLAAKAPSLAKIFERTKWGGGVWGNALKQAPKDVIFRDLGNGQVCKINRITMRVLLVDLAAYDRWKNDGGV